MSRLIQPRVLVVEDNPGDVFLFEESVRLYGPPLDILVAKDVDEGIALLAPEQQPIPCLALIDLHLPKRDGKVLLAFVREQQYLAEMPSVILSSSQRPADRDNAFALGAREVLVKPSDWNGYCQLIRHLACYWSPLSKPPTG